MPLFQSFDKWLSGGDTATVRLAQNCVMEASLTSLFQSDSVITHHFTIPSLLHSKPKGEFHFELYHSASRNGIH
jgi:hypothetical protein